MLLNRPEMNDLLNNRPINSHDLLTTGISVNPNITTVSIHPIENC